jgi:transposase InsO family protein
MEYNTYRPHSALGGLTPTEFAQQWRQTNSDFHGLWTTNRQVASSMALVSDPWPAKCD